VNVFDSMGFDSDAKLTQASVAAAVKAGFVWTARYISLGDETPGDLDSEEVKIIGGGGLRLYVVQHVPYPNWRPSPALAQQFGEKALSNMEKIAYAPGSHCFNDVEGVAKGTPPQVVTDHLQLFASIIIPRNPAGQYYGDSCILNGTQLHALVGVNSYWRAASRTPNIDVRGHAIRQFFPSVRVGGIDVDIDWLAADLLGERPLWMEAT
jgi:hypothetical protein